VRSLVTVLLQIYLLILRVKKFENWSLFDEDAGHKKSVPNISGHPVRCVFVCG